MGNYITRKKTLRGIGYEIEVPLPQYGEGVVVRIHALSDMMLARIEERAGYTLEEAMVALYTQDLTDEEIKTLQAAQPSHELTKKVLNLFSGEEIEALRSAQPSEELLKKASSLLSAAEIEALLAPQPTQELILKASGAMSPKLTLFLGELAKAGIIPDPDCACHGKGCDECNTSLLVEELRGFSVLQIGMAIIGASTSSWKDVESFFSAKRVPSGPA